MGWRCHIVLVGSGTVQLLRSGTNVWHCQLVDSAIVQLARRRSKGWRCQLVDSEDLQLVRERMISGTDGIDDASPLKLGLLRKRLD
jgi:hypothetical protein